MPYNHRLYGHPPIHRCPTSTTTNASVSRASSGSPLRLQGDGGGESFPVEEFYERVAKKEGVGEDEATRRARAVATVVQTTVTGASWKTCAPS